MGFNVLNMSLPHFLLSSSILFPHPSSSADAEPASAGDAPADPDHLIEDGEEGEEAVATEPISKEEAAERLLVGPEFDAPEIRLMEQAVAVTVFLLCVCRRRRRSSQS